MALADNIAAVRARINDALTVAGRHPEELTLVVVTKYVDALIIKELIGLGVEHIGENRLQEAVRKQAVLGDLKNRFKWHFIGSLQTNKARQVAAGFDLIHSLDRLSLAEALHQASRKLNKEIPVLIQVNVSREQTKHGVAPAEVGAFYTAVRKLSGLRPVGLMTMAPDTEDPETSRPVFRELRHLFEQIKRDYHPGPEWRELSMGMSNDYGVAIEEGATIVRIGSAIFSAGTEG
ncbi:YggS family pyridoxal phosphate-dependent enzyme [Capillibacterium thermochitinicola]|uniref:YggS family pyridoxal phosphate-dependent enzyme n=1 Tax=Capillibacterium thermochitinicola TaxID=2699427 RepID=UPI002F2B63BF